MTRHIGKHADRLHPDAGCDRERVFAAAWDKHNTQYAAHIPCTIDYLMNKASGLRPESLATSEECEVAATVIQWLGSPVGFHWLENTLEELGYKLTKKEGKK